MPNVFTIGRLAEIYNQNPRTLTGLFYTRRLDPARCPIFAGRRLIPEDYLPEVERVLLERGLLKEARRP